jgi:hypothetical protein
MKRSHSDKDVARWEKAYENAIAIHLDKLRTESSQANVDFHMGGLAGSYYMYGMTLIAGAQFGAAIDAFRSSTELWCKMYERYENGHGRPLEAGHFQSVLVAYVTGDDVLISRLVAHYRAEDGTPDSIFIGTALKLIATGDCTSAKTALTLPKPHFEPQFRGYPDCLDAIAHNNEEQFISALGTASEFWAKWASNQARGLPHSVCFIHGVGFIRLAETIFNKSISVTNEHIPQGLLG